MSFHLHLDPLYARDYGYEIDETQSPFWQAGYRTGRAGSEPSAISMEYSLYVRGYEAGARRRLYTRLWGMFAVSLLIAIVVNNWL